MGAGIGQRVLAGVAVPAALAGALVASPAQAAPQKAGFDPYSVPIPAVCDHRPTRLTHGRVSFGKDASGASRGGASLVNRKGLSTGRITDPIVAKQRGGSSAGAVAALPILCSKGGVTHPESVAVYARGDRLLASKDLGRVLRHEHADVMSISLTGSTVHVRWTAYEGAGFDVIHASADLVVHGRALVVTHLTRH